MVDGIVLLVDASEGPLPQTRFVLRKALNADMPVVLVVNKVDRSDARISEVVDETYELFMDLLDDCHSQDALDFPVVYASAKAGRASTTMPENGGMPDSDNLEPLFRTIIETIPAPVYTEGAPLQAHVTNLDASPVPRPPRAGPRQGGHAEQGPAGRVDEARRHQARTSRSPSCSSPRRSSASPRESAGPGDICAIAGIPEIMIGETLADPDEPGRAAADHRRRAGHLDDDRHQHLPAGRPRQGRQGHRPPGQGPPRQGAGRQRVASRCSRPSAPTPGRSRAVASWRWRSWSSRCAARATSSPSASRRWSPARSTASCTSRSSG